MSFYSYLKNNLNNDDVQDLLKRYPDIFKEIPDKKMNSDKIKKYIKYNVYDKKVFLNAWMNYFKWILLYEKKTNDILDR